MSTEKYSLSKIESWCDETIPEDRAVLALVAAVRLVLQAREDHRCAGCSDEIDAALARFTE